MSTRAAQPKAKASAKARIKARFVDEFRRDCRLANIHPEERPKIREYFVANGVGKGLRWLKRTYGITVQQSAWYKSLLLWKQSERTSAIQNFAEHAARAEQAARATSNTPMSEVEYQDALDRHFIAKALQEDKTEDYAAIRALALKSRAQRTAEQQGAQKLKLAERALAQKDRDLALAERRVALLESSAEKAREEMKRAEKKGGITAETRKLIERVLKGEEVQP